jgi:2-keto-4-pentenoate hydratase
VTTAAHLLAQARIKHQRLSELPEVVRPKTPAEAYSVQDGLIDELLAHYGGSLIGYKIACTDVIAQPNSNQGPSLEWLVV